jgi:hypothetical protein
VTGSIGRSGEQGADHRAAAGRSPDASDNCHSLAAPYGDVVVTAILGRGRGRLVPIPMG